MTTTFYHLCNEGPTAAGSKHHPTGSTKAAGRSERQYNAAPSGRRKSLFLAPGPGVHWLATQAHLSYHITGSDLNSCCALQPAARLARSHRQPPKNVGANQESRGKHERFCTLASYARCGESGDQCRATRSTTACETWHGAIEMMISTTSAGCWRVVTSIAVEAGED